VSLDASFWKGRRVLVTGHTGFKGAWLSLWLRQLGAEVTGYSLAPPTEPSLFALADLERGMASIEADIRDAARLRAALVQARPEVVFHLAAQIDVRVSVADPALDARINVIGSLNVLEGARRAGARKVVFASSGGTIYGDVDPGDLPVTEAHPQQPVSPYGVSKKCVTDYLYAYRELHQLEYTSLALANVYGPRQDPHGEAGVVAIFAGRLLAGERCRIFGDGSQTRDYVFVDDVVDAFVRAAERGSGLLCNVGTGVETSVTGLHTAMAANAGVPDDPEFAPARAGELARSCLDASRAKLHLGWEPFTDLPAGTAAVLDWFRAQDAPA